MAARNSIIHIDFQANAGKANAALQALQQESRKAKDEVTRLRAELQNAKATNLPTDQIQKLEAELKAAESASRQWSQALNNNLKGVRSLDEAIKQFNGGKGSVEGMSAALSKAARNAAALQKSRETTGSQTWKEMDALIKALDKNILKANNDLKTMTATLQQGGSVSKSTLTQAKSDLQSLISLEEKGTNEWKRYTAQLSVVEGALKRLTLEEQRMVGQQTLGRAFRGDFKTANAQTLEQTIAKLREYQQVINDPNGSGARHYAAAEAQIQKLQASLDLLKQKTAEASGQAMSFKQAMQVGIAAGGGNFKGTVEQLNLAKKTLEQLSQSAAKGGLAWRRMQDQLSNINLELARTGHISKETQAILNQPKGRSFNELKAAIEQGRAALNNMRQTTEAEKKQFDQLAASVKNADIQMKQLSGAAKGTASTFDKAWSRLKTYVGLYVGAAVAMQKIVATMGDLMELSDKMGEVRKTTGFTADEVGRLTESIANLDSRTNLTRLMELASLAGSVGLKTQQDVQGFTEAADQLIVALPELGNESARTIIKIANATGDLEKNGGDVRETLERVGSTIIALRANSASAAGPITDFVSRVGAVGAQSGISIDQIAALGSTIDALGGRVEMSATALSRMIPAIKNNSFAIANSIGVTEKYLKSLTPIQQMVLIFQKMRDNIQGIDTSTEEGQEQMAQTIEGMLGRNATMREVMKDLEQQGARAGIVFGLLSQNVDELEKQLGIAGEAYRENTALLNEYNNMNETTAAKWERLKNQVEEFFVGDQAQRWLGGIIDGLRWIVNFLTGNLSPALNALSELVKTFLVYWGILKIGLGEAVFIKAAAGLKAMATGFTNLIGSTKNYIVYSRLLAAAHKEQAMATTAVAVAEAKHKVAAIEARMAQNGLNKAMIANVWMAVAAAVLYAGKVLWDYYQKSKAAAKQLDVLAQAEKKAKEESIQQRTELERLYRVTQDQTNSMEERKKALHDMVGDEKYKQYYENLSSESEFATAAANAYKELAAEIMATARARALDAKAEELQRKRIDLMDKRQERENWENENRDRYRQGKQEYQQRLRYTSGATSGAAGFTEAQMSQRGAAATKPAIVDEFESSISEKNRIDAEIGQIDKDIERLEKQVKTIKPEGATDTNGNGNGGGGGGGNSPYGTYNRVTSPYGDWDADSLVNRRKEMLERVRALANGADVQAVLSEDAKFISEATRNNIKTTRDAIEWYNTERLKIQDALHEKYLTNTGDWMDPSKQKGRKKRLEDEWKYYLDELDAYYTERKTRIQEAGTDEGVTEAEVQNRTLANEMEWRQRRAELQKLYANKSAQVTADEQQAIYDILASRTGDTAKFVRQDIAKTVGFILKIGEKSRVEMDRLMGRLDKGIEQDFLKQQTAVTKQMKAIQDIIDKERPFNGITKNMRENLVTMGILTADMTAERNKLMAAGEDMSDFNMRQASEEAKRTAWLLGQAEEAYALTVEEMMRRMADAGMTAWADELRRNPEMQEALLAQLHQTYDKVQEAIKKEASLVKKEMDIWWNDIEIGRTQSRKGGFEAMLTSLGLAEDQVKRANALIGAGQASERVADRLAIKQMQVRLTMQETYYAKMRQMWADRIAALRAQGKELDAQHAEMSRNLALSEEQKKLDEQRVAIANQIEESQNRLYKELREWGELISGSVLSVMEASNAGQGEYYTEQAKKRLTGESTYGRYIVVENAGTADATASYRTLSDEEALRIEQQNAMADAWKKVMDDIAEKMNQTITDQVNAMMQNASIDANTDALGLNTEAIAGLTAAMGGGEGGGYKAANDPKIQALNTYLQGKVNPAGGGEAAEEGDAEGMPKPFWQMTGEDVEQAKVNTETLWQHYTETGTEAMQEMSESVSEMPNIIQPFNMNEEQREVAMQGTKDMYDAVGSASDAATARQIANQNKVAANEQRTDTQMTKSNASAFAKMTQAANLYGIAYQTMSNDNLTSTQKFGMMAIQAAGQAGISALSVSLAQATGQTASNLPAIGSEAFKINPIAGAAIFAAISAVLGGLLGLAASKVAKSKAEIASVTGAAASAGRLSTGMLTYAEGNVNEFTDPSSLREGRTYNVDAADGRTYRARYMGRNPRTHITNGPEFHLSGERGREMIIDADTTHQIVYNEPAVMQAIKTLSGTRGAYGLRRGRGRGMAAFADGNVADLVEMENGEWAVDNASSAAGMTMEMATSLQASIDRNSEVLERAMAEGFKGVFVINGKGGLVDSYDKGKKEALRHGQKY